MTSARFAAPAALVFAFACSPEPEPGGAGPGPEIDLSARSLAPADVDMSLTGSTVPGSLAPGERRAVQVTLQNTGTRAWSPGTVALVPVDPAWRWPVRVVSSPVGAGQSVTFSFVVTAPDAAGPSAVTARAYSLFPGEQGVFGAPISLPVQVDGARTPDLACGFVSSDLPATLTPGARRTVSVTVRNDGASGWPGGGAFCLYQRDDVAGRWGGRYCADLASPVSPGATATIRFPIDAPTTPGTYAFRRQMFDSRGPANGGVGFFDLDTPCVDLSVTVGGTAPLDAAVVRHTLLPALDAGERVRGSVTVQNTGSAAWPADGSIVLHSTTMPVTLFGRHVSTLPGPVAAGETVTFEVPVQAPLSPGSYTQQWRMFATSGQYFGSGLSVPTTVAVPPAGFDAEIVQTDLPSLAANGVSETYEVRMRNTGAEPWPGDGSFSLAFEGQPANVWGPASVPLTAAVPPGGEVVFSLALTAPAVNGRYVHRWRMTGPGGAFGERVDVPVDVVDSLGALQITRTTLPIGSVGFDYEVPMLQSGGTSPVWSAVGLPAGLTMDASGRIFGVPTSAGTSQVQFSLTEAGYTPAQATVALEVRAPPTDLPRWAWGRIGGNDGGRDTLVWDGAQVWDVGGLPSLPRTPLFINPQEGSGLGNLPPLCLTDTHAVWSGRELLVFGGRDCQSGQPVQRGWAYQPFLSSRSGSGTVPEGARRPLDETTVPGVRAGGVAVWAGTEMLVFGGDCAEAGCYTQGARYDPSTDRWTLMSTLGAPDSTAGAVIVWTGSELLVYGGTPQTSGRWTRATNTWAPMAMPAAPVSAGVGVWTGTELIVWDGAAGAIYDPVADTWASISTAGAPIGREYLKAVWSGSEMIVVNADGGGHYDPSMDRWRRIVWTKFVPPTNDTPALWTGREMVFFGSGAHSTYRPLVAAEPGICRSIFPPPAGALTTQFAGSLSGLRGYYQLRESRIVIQSAGGTAPYRSNVFVNGAFYTQEFRPGMAPVPCNTTYCVFRVTTADDVGNVACDLELVVKDQPPTISATLTPVGPASSGIVDFAASCTDPEGPCEMRFLSDFGGSSVSGQLDLSAYAGQSVWFFFEARDSTGQIERYSRFIFVPAP